MSWAGLSTVLAALALLVGADRGAWSQETLKVAIPQRGAWDAGVAELGQRGGIFKKHGLDLEILYVQAGPESIQAVIGGSMDIATAAGVSAAVGTFAKGAPIRIIGSEMIGAPDLYWYVPASSPIKMTMEQADSVPSYIQIDKPMTFQGGPITTVAPSTTAAALTSLVTGVPRPALRDRDLQRLL